MKKIILLTVFCFISLFSCKSGGETENTLTNNDKEKALLQREKDLLERENASLKNKQENSKEVRQEQQQVEQKQQYSEPKSNFRKSVYRAKNGRVHFYNNANYNSRNASFIVEGQTPIALSIDG